jgi:nucleoside-diphosphate-sugar epimerase
VSRARARLGFRAEVALEEGLTRYLDWFRRTYPDPAACLGDESVRNW